MPVGQGTSNRVKVDNWAEFELFVAAGSQMQIGDGVEKLLIDPSGAAYFTHGKTLKSKTGSASATFTVIAAVATKRIKVYSLSLTLVSATAVTVTFKDGAGGTALATYLLQTPADVMGGITENVAAPSSLFEGSASTLLEMAFSAAVSVTYNLRYWEEAA